MPGRTILHLTCMVSTKYGGLEHYVAETIRRCNEAGDRTVLQYEAPIRSRAWAAELRELGAEVVVSQLNAPNPLASAARIAGLIRATRPEIVQTYHPRTPTLLLIALLARLLRVPRLIAGVHSNMHLRGRSIRTFALNRFDHVYGVSHAVADNLVEAGVDPGIVSTHYLGIFGHVERSDAMRAEYRREFGIPAGDKVFALIGFASAVKGVDLLLRAFQKLSEARPGVHLIVVGVDREQSELPELAGQLGIGERVHWAGIRDEGWRLLNAADVYVQSSRSEGLCMAMIEATALKLPCVSTRVTGPTEIVVNGETGYLCEPDDVESLSATMSRMLDEESRWPVMGEAGYRRFVERFRGEESVKSFVERYYPA